MKDRRLLRATSEDKNEDKARTRTKPGTRTRTRTSRRARTRTRTRARTARTGRRAKENGDFDESSGDRTDDTTSSSGEDMDDSSCQSSEKGKEQDDLAMTDQALREQESVRMKDLFNE